MRAEYSGESEFTQSYGSDPLKLHSSSLDYVFPLRFLVASVISACHSECYKDSNNEVECSRTETRGRIACMRNWLR